MTLARRLAGPLSVILVTTACVEPDITEIPELPPAHAFEVAGLDAFAGPLGPNLRARTATGVAWTHAFSRVSLLRELVQSNLELPRTAFELAASQEPTWNDEFYQWEWHQTAVRGDEELQVKLRGSREFDETSQWHLFVKRPSDTAYQAWLLGRVGAKGNQGSWQILIDHEAGLRYLQVVWQPDELEQFSIEYKLVHTGAPDDGRTVTFGLREGQIYDRYLHVSTPTDANRRVELDNLTEIEWNFTSKAGRTLDRHHFGDEQWRCWDATTRSDVVCP